MTKHWEKATGDKKLPEKVGESFEDILDRAISEDEPSLGQSVGISGELAGRTIHRAAPGTHSADQRAHDAESKEMRARVIGVLRTLPDREAMAVFNAIFVAGRNWTEKDTQDRGTISRDIIARLCHD